MNWWEAAIYGLTCYVAGFLVGRWWDAPPHPIRRWRGKDWP